jgi:hypothetical protein
MILSSVRSGWDAEATVAATAKPKPHAAIESADNRYFIDDRLIGLFSS